jgi:hypothetical protein
MSSFLPPEIWLDILELVGPQSETYTKRAKQDNPLLALLLVSKYFAALTRPLLYREIRVYSAKMLDSACTAVETDGSLHPIYLCAVRTSPGHSKDEEAKDWQRAIDGLLKAATSSVERVTVLSCTEVPALTVSLDWFEAGKDAYLARFCSFAVRPTDTS